MCCFICETDKEKYAVSTTLLSLGGPPAWKLTHAALDFNSTHSVLLCNSVLTLSVTQHFCSLTLSQQDKGCVWTNFRDTLTFLEAPVHYIQTFSYKRLMYIHPAVETHTLMAQSALRIHSVPAMYIEDCWEAVGFHFSGPELKQCGKAVCAYSAPFLLPLCTSSCLQLSSKTLPSARRR